MMTQPSIDPIPEPIKLVDLVLKDGSVIKVKPGSKAIAGADLQAKAQALWQAQIGDKMGIVAVTKEEAAIVDAGLVVAQIKKDKIGKEGNNIEAQK